MNRRRAHFGAHPTPPPAVIVARVDPRRERRIARRRARDARRLRAAWSRAWRRLGRIAQRVGLALAQLPIAAKRAVAALAGIKRAEGGEIPTTQPMALPILISEGRAYGWPEGHGVPAPLHVGEILLNADGTAYRVTDTEGDA